jgi:hypothetical protein
MDRHSSSSRGRGLSTILVVAVASGTALGGAYWLMSGEGDALRDLTMPRSASAADGGAGFEASTDGASRGGTPSDGAPSGDAGLQSASPNEGAARDTRRNALDEAIAFAGTTGAATERAASQPQPQPRMSAGATESATAGDSASAAMSPAAEAGAKAEADSSKQESSKQESPKQESPKQDAPPQNTNTQDTPKQDAPAQGTTPPTFRNGNAGAADQSQPAKAAPAAGSPEAKLAEGLALGATEPVKSRLLLSQALLPLLPEGVGAVESGGECGGAVDEGEGVEPVAADVEVGVGGSVGVAERHGFAAAVAEERAEDGGVIGL